MVERGVEAGQVNQKNSFSDLTRNQLLSISAHLAARVLEKRPTALDWAAEVEGDVEVERKLDEIYRYLKQEKKEHEKKIRELKEEIYRKAESKQEPEWLRGFTEKQVAQIIKSLHAIALTKGCSLQCPNCGLDAEKLGAGKVSFGDLIYLMRKYGKFMDFVPLIYYGPVANSTIQPIKKQRLSC